jgi:hypothetical protein
VAESRVTVLQGTLDLLILKALSAGELHGLGVLAPHRADHARHLLGTAGVALPCAPSTGRGRRLSSAWQPSEKQPAAPSSMRSRKRDAAVSAMRPRSGTVSPSRCAHALETVSRGLS